MWPIFHVSLPIFNCNLCKYLWLSFQKFLHTIFLNIWFLVQYCWTVFSFILFDGFSNDDSSRTINKVNDVSYLFYHIPLLHFVWTNTTFNKPSDNTKGLIHKLTSIPLPSINWINKLIHFSTYFIWVYLFL